MTTTYATKIQFRNAARKALVRINNDNQFYRGALTFIGFYDANDKPVMGYGKWAALHVSFEFGSISADEHARLMNAGFEVREVEVPAEYGKTRIARLYRLPR